MLKTNLVRLLFAIIVSTVMSEVHVYAKGILFLGPKKIKSIIGPYPQDESEAEKQDFETLLYYQMTRTEEDCKAASEDVSMDVESLFAKEGGPLTKKEARKFSLKIASAYIMTGINVSLAKKIYKRPRPYLKNPLITPCIKKEKSFAYPSGHTILSRVIAHVLTYKYPERASQFMDRADEVAFHRILGGVHHPSDIVAGKKLADAMAKKLLSSKKFILELNAM